MYGKVAETPQSETTPFHPRSPYAIAKVFAHWMTVQYRDAYGLIASQRHPVQPRVAAARRDVRHPQGDPRHRRDPRRRRSDALPRQPRRPARLGLRAGVRRGDVADAPAARAGRLRDRHRRDAHASASSSRWRSRLVGLDWEQLRRDRPALLPADRGGRAVRRRLARPRESSAGGRATTFEELVRLMLEADLREAGLDPDRPLVGPLGTTCRMSFWTGRRVMVTGGGGFLGHGRRRAARGGRARTTSSCRAATDYDLRTAEGVDRRARRRRGPTSSSTSPRSSAGSAPTARTRAGSSTRTRSWASSSWSRRAWPASRSSSRSAPSARTRSSRRCRSSEDDLWNGYPEETNAPYGLAKKMLLVQGQAYRQQYGFDVIHLIPVNLYGPGDNFDPASSHVIPALIKKCVDARDARRRPHRGLGHRLGVARVPVRRRRRRGDRRSPPSATTAPSRSTSASASEITIRDLVELIVAADRLRGRDPLGRHASPTASRGGRSTRAGRASGSGSRRRRPSRTACARRSSGTSGRASRHGDRAGEPGRDRHGAAGQDGYHLVARLLAEGGTVHATVRDAGRVADLRTLPHADRLTVHELEITDADACRRLLGTVRPDEVLQPGRPEQRAPLVRRSDRSVADQRRCGARSARGPAHGEPCDPVLPVVLDGHVRNVARRDDDPRRSVGLHAAEPVRCRQGRGPRPVRYRRAFDLRVSCGILSNHESSRRPAPFLTAKVAAYVRSLRDEHGTVRVPTDPLRVGNLAIRREWGSHRLCRRDDPHQPADRGSVGRFRLAARGRHRLELPGLRPRDGPPERCLGADRPRLPAWRLPARVGSDVAGSCRLDGSAGRDGCAGRRCRPVVHPARRSGHDRDRSVQGSRRAGLATADRPRRLPRGHARVRRGGTRVRSWGTSLTATPAMPPAPPPHRRRASGSPFAAR